jgi:phage repressor protein C with HTH and peptisase S24 domain
MTSVGSRIREARKAKGLNQEQLAEALDLSTSAIGMYESDRREPSLEVFERLAKALGVRRETLAFGEDAYPQGGMATRLDASEAMPRVPVVGTASAGTDGHWYELEYPTGYGDGHVIYPSKDRNAYALRVKGDSMRPRIKPGEFVVIEPNSTVTPGDEVLVKTKDGRQMIKVLASRRRGQIELSSVNNDYQPLTFEESEIESISLVAGIVTSTLYSAE